MEFEWDDEKSEATRRKRGLTFNAAIPIFDGPHFVDEDLRWDYGERRFRAIGMSGGQVLQCTFTDREQPDGSTVRRIISLHVAPRRARNAYREAFKE